ncbi:host attachment protein [Polaromonas sp.]|uniref:host attachment protein n=1 Tax=Polaromonas sp. TaxID=1869339 RepID=UPI003BAC801B
MKPDWILIANATHARLLEQERGSPMVILESFAHPSSREKISALATDRAGHESTDRSYGGAVFEPRHDAKSKEHTLFARQLADQLEKAATQGKCRSLVIFASSPFLGQLKAELGAATKRLLSTTHDLDLTSFGLSELELRIGRVLAP